MCTSAFVVFAFAVVTVFALATTGFDKQPEYTTNPNATLARPHWFTHDVFTGGDDSLDPECQALDLPVGYEFMTTNQGLHYTVTSISLRHSFSTPDQEPIRRPSVAYLNNNLTDCQIESVSLYMRKAGDNDDTFFYDWWAWLDSSAEAAVNCTVVNEEGEFTIAFSTSYRVVDTLYGGTELYNYIAVDDARAHASIWWGSRLVNNYFLGTQAVMSADYAPELNFIRAGMIFQRDSHSTSITSNDLFSASYFFMRRNYGVSNNADNPSGHGLYNNESFQLSKPLTEGLSFAKVFSSLILVDLGNSKAPNFLLDQDLLQYALNASNDFNRQPGGVLTNTNTLDWWKWATISPPGKPWLAQNGVEMSRAFSSFSKSGEIGQLGTKDATIYVQYVCMVPRKKSIGTIIFFTLVANFSLFGVVWKIYKAVKDRRATEDSRSMYCEGCIVEGHSLDMIEDSVDSFSKLSRYSRVRKHRSSSSTSSKALLQEPQVEEPISYV